MDTLKYMTNDELSHIVDLYPWFAVARKELCMRLGQPSDAALYVASRSVLFSAPRMDYTDPSLSEIIQKAPSRRVVVVGGDFFSQDQYDEVRNDESVAVPGFRGLSSDGADRPSGPSHVASSTSSTYQDFCTETLAQIYAEQGYYDQAKYIYSKLSLRYPEKNTYFAALIGKLNEEINN